MQVICLAMLAVAVSEMLIILEEKVLMPGVAEGCIIGTVIMGMVF